MAEIVEATAELDGDGGVSVSMTFSAGASPAAVVVLSDTGDEPTVVEGGGDYAVVDPNGASFTRIVFQVGGFLGGDELEFEGQFDDVPSGELWAHFQAIDEDESDAESVQVTTDGRSLRAWMDPDDEDIYF